MAICVLVDPTTGALMPDPTPLAQCTGYVLEDASDYLTHSIFQIPDGTSLAAAWSAGFVLPMTLGLVAWAVAKPTNFIK